MAQDRAHRLASLFQARTIALIGASDRNPFSLMAAQNIERLGFQGAVHMVNPRAMAAHGRPGFASCAAIGEPVDAAYVSVPQSAVLDAVDEAAAAGIRNFVVVSSGFAELGAEGAALQQALTERIRAQDSKLLGPNSLGFLNFVDRVAVGALSGPFGAAPGRLAVLSASGSTGIQIASFAHQQGIALSHLISTGNEAGLSTAAVLDYLVDDPGVAGIALFLEAVRDPELLVAAAERARQAHKPIALLKVGAAEDTARLVAAHTGSLVGDDRVFDAACERLGLARVRSVEELVVTAAAMADLGPRSRKGVAVVSISGGACEIVADRARDSGVPVPQFGAETKARLSEVVSELGQTHNPLDLTGGAMRDPAIWEKVLRIIAADPAIGTVLCNFDLPVAPMPEWQSAWEHIAAGLNAAEPKGALLTSFIQPPTEHGRRHAEALGIPAVIHGIQYGLQAIGAVLRWSEFLARGESLSPSPASAAAIARPVGERAALAYLEQQGVPVVPSVLATSADAAVEAAARIGGPVALKIAAPDLPHKTEFGGVALGVSGADAVAQAYARVLAAVAAARPDAAIEGVSVAPMRSGVELFAGIRRDPDWGLVMAVGLGGIWVELLQDVALVLLPATPAEIGRALDRLRGRRLLDGYRGGAAVDRDALARIMSRIGDAALALGPDLEALEVNPLLAEGARIEAADALAVWTA